MTSETTALTDDERARAVVLLLDLYEDLEALSAYAKDRPRPPGLRPVPAWVADLPSAVAGDSVRARIRRWANVFDDELKIVRAARNSVAHSLPVADDDLASAVRIAARLLMYARVSGHSENYEQSIAFQDARIGQGLHFPAKSSSAPRSHGAS